MAPHKMVKFILRCGRYLKIKQDSSKIAVGKTKTKTHSKIIFGYLVLSSAIFGRSFFSFFEVSMRSFFCF